ncbi:MAG: thiamine diphosphokinase [Candidatus Eisenbacteria bacterium]|nr:thiamine diphosphokinase [Candidatus Eisenbacteria bacterium]
MKNLRTAVILANGTPPGADLLRPAVASAALFVCADGGADAARALGVTPHAIVGDLDSITPETLAHYHDVPVHRDTDTSRTDFEKAVELVLARGPFEQIRVFGAGAGRLDHILGNLSVLLRYLGRAPLVLEDEHGRSWAAAGDVRLVEPAGTVVSFFALGEPAEGVSTEGLRYPLSGARLEMGAQDSVSNVVEAMPAWIRVARGRILVTIVTRA